MSTDEIGHQPKPLDQSLADLRMALLTCVEACMADIVIATREHIAREIVDTYPDWTLWVENDKAAVAKTAALEIATAIRKGRPLTHMEIAIAIRGKS